MIAPINVVIKMAAMALAGCLATRGCTRYFWARGAAAGMAYAIAGFVLFSLLDGMWGMPGILLGDIAMGAVVGFCAAIIVLIRTDKVSNR